MNKKIAWVLPGGAAWGRWQAGALQFLLDSGSVPNIICGTSVGGLNTLAAASGASLKELWGQITKNKDVFDGSLDINIFNIWRLLGKSLLEPKGLYKLIDKTFTGVLGQIKVPVYITTTELVSGERKLFSSFETPMANSAFVAKCTSAIPVAFPALQVAPDRLYVDGGLGRNNPVQVAVDAGATHIILIGTSPTVYEPKIIKNKVADIVSRSVDVTMHIFEEESWDELKYHKDIKVLDLYPDKSMGSSLDFTQVQHFNEGYEAAFKKVWTFNNGGFQ